MNYLDWIAILLLLASVGLLVWILKMQQIIRKIQKTLGNIGRKNGR